MNFKPHAVAILGSRAFLGYRGTAGYIYALDDVTNGPQNYSHCFHSSQSIAPLDAACRAQIHLQQVSTHPQVPDEFTVVFTVY